MTSLNTPLAGRNAVVTGASRGIGKAIAIRLASAGAHVILAARSVEKPTEGFTGTVHDVAEVIRGFGGTATPLALDVADAQSREQFAQACAAQVGQVDILVNNAGTPLYKQVDEYSAEDFRQQIGQMRKMGGLSGLVDKLPAELKAAAANAQVDERKIARQEAIISSMTPQERAKPELLKASRKRRIAAGSGVPVQEVNQLLAQFEQAQKMMKMMAKGGMQKMMRGMRGLLPGR